MKELRISETLDVSLEEFFSLFLSDTSTFDDVFHRARGDIDITFTPWVCSSTAKWTRTHKYRTPVTTSNSMIRKLAGDYVELVENQEYFHEQESLHLHVCPRVSGSFGAQFLSSAVFIARPLLKGQKVHLNLTVTIEYNGTWFKDTIESVVLSALSKGFNLWRELAVAHVGQHAKALTEHITTPVPEVEIEEEYYDAIGDSPARPAAQGSADQLDISYTEVVSSMHLLELRLSIVEKLLSLQLKMQSKEAPARRDSAWPAWLFCGGVLLAWPFVATRLLR